MNFQPSPIYFAPLKVTGYACIICKKYHKEGSKKFIEHWDRHFDKDNRYMGNNGKK
jgi:hypothetical protein